MMLVKYLMDCLEKLLSVRTYSHIIYLTSFLVDHRVSRVTLRLFCMPV